MFVGLNDTYMDFVCDRLLYVVDTQIHHVESWGSFAKNFQKKGGRMRRSEGGESEYRQQRNQWGIGAVKYANNSWMYS